MTHSKSLIHACDGDKPYLHAAEFSDFDAVCSTLFITVSFNPKTLQDSELEVFDSAFATLPSNIVLIRTDFFLKAGFLRCCLYQFLGLIISSYVNSEPSP